jgi:hypothetical protein
VLIEPPVETHPVEEGQPTEVRPPFEPVPVSELPQVTKSGLARRVPKRANLDQDPVRPGVESSRPAIVPGRRSPDDVRAMLARYRTGLQRGRAPETSTTDDEGMA